MPSKPIAGWRALLRHHGPGFAKWCIEQSTFPRRLDAIASSLERFLISQLGTADDCRAFWHAIPAVRAACNDRDTYEQPWAAEAYAYSHLLERYKRTWETLEHLCELAWLPLGADGVRALDVGAGPAPSLYAAYDFYADLMTYATACDIPGLRTPLPRLDMVEGSASMERFVHRFSEFCLRNGPYQATFSDFSGLDIPAERDAERRSLARKEYYDGERDDYAYEYSRDEANTIALRLWRYRLVFFSNFLTLPKTVDAFTPELGTLLSDLRPGAVVIVLGATGESYQSIYSKLENIAVANGLQRLGNVNDTLGDAIHIGAQRIKQSQHRVYQHIANIVGESQIPRTKEWPDYWNPLPSPKARSEFGLRAFRRFGRRRAV